MTLKVGIIGAGIGGLSAAIALRRTGAQVEVFERSNFKDEIGAAITITPNGMRVLRHFGFDPKTARGVQSKQMRMVDPHSLKDVVVEDFSHVEYDYGGPFMFFHRVDLHTALKEMAVSSDDRYLGSPVVIHNGNSVTSLDSERATFVLDNGETFAKDLIVIADGVRASATKLIDEITQKDVPLEDIGSSFYRCLIPFSEVNKDPDLARVFKGQDPGFWVPFELSTGSFLVTYPCRDGKMLNVAFRHKTKAENEHAVDWNTDTNIQDITAMVGGFNPLVAKLFSLSTSVSVHKLFRREPLETYTRGRAVIIGDAAHPIQPTHAQGAVLAIEEAAALKALFEDTQDSEQVAERLGLYDNILKRRIHVTQLLSDAQPGISSVLRKRAEDIWGEGIFPPDAMNFTKPIRNFFYAWDVMQEADKVLESALWRDGYMHAVPFTKLRFWGSSCRVCSLYTDIALDCVRGHLPDISKAKFNDETEEKLKLKNTHITTLFNYFLIDGPEGMIDFEIFEDGDADTFEGTGELFSRRHHVGRYTNSRESFERAREWLSECLAEHACPRSVAAGVPLPKRLLDVEGAFDDPVRLIETRGDEFPYVCLSHCWGDPRRKQLKTTTRTVESHMKKIHWIDLPATFRDAVTVCRSMNVKYLWVDSLCILQSFADITPDELEVTEKDFAQENSTMARTYQNSHFTISADLSDHMDSGFFSRNPVNEYKKEFTTDNGDQAFWYTRKPLHQYPENIPCLETRGWTLQEFLLPPRVLHFGESDIAWRCKTRIICECGQIDSQDLNTYNHRFLDTQELANPPPNDSKGALEWWAEIVRVYTSRQLTNPADKLPALSGLAQLRKKVRGGVYLAGLWQDSLLHDLCWFNDYGIESPPVRGHRPPYYRAPSWSWAATDIDADTVCSWWWPRTYRRFASWFFSQGEPEWACDILQVSCEPATTDPMGQVRSGFLDIKTSLTLSEIRRHPTKDSLWTINILNHKSWVVTFFPDCVLEDDGLKFGDQCAGAH
ncbi:hypothetical protein FGADI_691 [Fusarium gaditjirri]|uniref:FAD-binding domain-containing protein n=1 Tax=Fusarium gaditjirri TaxID=282569 RepID=A0A8H4X3S8_9HYPO|nr:hypothetical protein FGADI_691 [Fusarium gaditjirri]